MANNGSKPVVIAGAGISGLLLAQYLRKSGVPFQIFERDGDLETRGVGWGLTLHWSLPALRSLLPEDLVRRLPEAYVDRAAAEQGLTSTFPFFDLSSGELKASTPTAPESDRIRVTRDRFRRLLATGIDIQWGKGISGFESGDDAVTVQFEDGSSTVGRFLVACDGGNSQIRRVLHPSLERHLIPIRVLGARVDFAPDQIEPLRKLDPFFLQGADPKTSTFAYFSMLDAPGNNAQSTDKYTTQMVVSWPIRAGFFGKPEGVPFPPTDEARRELIRTFAEGWADPFRALAHAIPQGTEIKTMDLLDFPPPKGLRGAGRVALVGDAFHAMAMYRGEGANHAIVDVADLVELVVAPHIVDKDSPSADLRAAVNVYEDRVIDRARPGVLASRQACLDAHNWDRINEKSPLLSRRVMKVDFNEADSA